MMSLYKIRYLNTSMDETLIDDIFVCATNMSSAVKTFENVMEKDPISCKELGEYNGKLLISTE